MSRKTGLFRKKVGQSEDHIQVVGMRHEKVTRRTGHKDVSAIIPRNAKPETIERMRKLTGWK